MSGAGLLPISATATACCVAIALLLVGAGPAPPLYRDSPPPGYSGGFGEPSCGACHFFNEVNDPAGAFTVEGVPERYQSGRSYPLTVKLTRPAMATGGFQLTARFEAGGAQAGRLEPGSGANGRLGVTASRDVLYAHHLLPGTRPVAADTLRWTIVWTAPNASGAVLFSAAANAADGDDSVSGDYIYTTQVRSHSTAD